MMRRFFVVLVFGAMCAACDSNRVFEENKDFSKRYWLAQDTVQFEFSISEGGVPYNVLYNVRNSLDYRYSRIFVMYTLEDSTHTQLASRLVNNYLFDVKTGKPFGSSGIGDIYDHRFPLLENRPLAAGKYYVKLQQFVRTDSDTLRGVLATGIRVEKLVKE